MSLRLIVFGAGGLAREVRDIASHVVAFAVDDAMVGTAVGDTPVIGLTEARARLKLGDASGYAIAVGDPVLRAHFAASVHRDALPVSVRGPWSFVSNGASIEAGVVLQSGVIVSDGAVIERHAYINIGACVAHDVLVEELAVVGPHAMLCGGAIIEARAYLGASVTVLPNVRIGRGAYVGAGATVLRDVAPGDTVAGVPAKSLRKD